MSLRPRFHVALQRALNDSNGRDTDEGLSQEAKAMDHDDDDTVRCMVRLFLDITDAYQILVAQGSAEVRSYSASCCGCSVAPMVQQCLKQYVSYPVLKFTLGALQCHICPVRCTCSHCYCFSSADLHSERAIHCNCSEIDQIRMVLVVADHNPIGGCTGDLLTPRLGHFLDGAWNDRQDCSPGH